MATRRKKSDATKPLHEWVRPEPPAEVMAELRAQATDDKGRPLLCTACGEDQFAAPDGSGVTCANGHGGAEGIPWEEVPVLDRKPAAESTRVDWLPCGAKGCKSMAIGDGSFCREHEEGAVKTGTTTFLAWGGVVSSIYSLDPVRLHKKLVDELALGDGATSYGEVLHALDKAERNSYDAARLEQAARLELKQRELEVDAELEVLRTNARAALEQEKKEGLRSKAPTIDEVRDRVVATWQTKVAELERSVAELKGTCAALEQLARSWNSRCASLRAMMERVAPVGSR